VVLGLDMQLLGRKRQKIYKLLILNSFLRVVRRPDSCLKEIRGMGDLSFFGVPSTALARSAAPNSAQDDRLFEPLHTSEKFGVEEAK
jgi:hypothetical protein